MCVGDTVEACQTAEQIRVSFGGVNSCGLSELFITWGPARTPPIEMGLGMPAVYLLNAIRSGQHVRCGLSIPVL